MKIFLGILFLFFGVCNMILAFSTDYDKNLRNKVVTWVATICAGFCFGIAFDYVGVFERPKAFPAKEYTLKLKITTMEELVDTTYIITRK